MASAVYSRRKANQTITKRKEADEVAHSADPHLTAHLTKGAVEDEQSDLGHDCLLRSKNGFPTQRDRLPVYLSESVRKTW